jgi:hypothetical protein
VLDAGAKFTSPGYVAAVEALADATEGWPFRRRDLPFGHPARRHGGLDDRLVLAIDDTLHEVEQR